MNDPHVDLVAKLWKLGRSEVEISRRINKPLGWVNQVINDAETKEAAAKLENPVDDGTEIWSGDAKRFHQERLVPRCFYVWESILDDPEASHASKLKATEMIMKYDTSLVDNTKVDEDKITNIQISEEAVQRLIRLGNKGQ